MWRVEDVFKEHFYDGPNPTVNLDPKRRVELSKREGAAWVQHCDLGGFGER
jgi:hypothetical protein